MSLYAQVIIDISHEKVDRPFTYLVPEALREKARKKQELLDKRLGRAEEPDQVIRGLTADMEISQGEDGATY